MKNQNSVSGLENHLGYWLRFVSNHVSDGFRLKMKREGVTVAEWVVLRALYDNEGVNPSHIAHTLGMTRGAVSKLLDRLAAKKLVKSIADKGDRRYQTVVLTESGRKIVPRLARLADENDDAFFDVLDTPEKKLLVETLKKLITENKLSQIPLD